MKYESLTEDSAEHNDVSRSNSKALKRILAFRNIYLIADRVFCNPPTKTIEDRV